MIKVGLYIAKWLILNLVLLNKHLFSLENSVDQAYLASEQAR